MLEAKLGPEIAKIPGVKRVDSGLVDFTSMDELGPVGVLVQGWEPDSSLMGELKIQPGGRLLKASDKRGVLLGERLAASLDKKVGDTMSVFDDKTYTVRGIFKSNTVYENGSMVVLLRDLQQFMGRPGQVSGFTVVAENPNDKERSGGSATPSRGWARTSKSRPPPSSSMPPPKSNSSAPWPGSLRPWPW